MSRSAPAHGAFTGAPRRLAGDVELRAWEERDLRMLVEAFAVPDIVASMRPPAPTGMRGARDWVSTRRAMSSFGRGAAWAIATGRESTAIGSVELRTRDTRLHTAEIGYWLLPRARGRGVARAAVSAVCEWALGQPPVERVVAVIDAANEASQQLALALGFVCSSRTCSNDGWAGDWLVFEHSAGGAS